ncbi:MAG: hypothetical protein K2L39_08940 [Muribaculaceae bacterium]|nr:hypothetical protein [Muribaculaceae bacterium]
MRKELYRALVAALKEVEYGAIKHIDLWNRDIEFIEQDEPWERPAVFIEFEPITWHDIVPAKEYRAEARVRLHIITDWMSAGEGVEAVGKYFDLPDKIHEAIAGLEGETFKDFQLAESYTNHDHEDIVESIEVYTFVALKSVGE